MFVTLHTSSSVAVSWEISSNRHAIQLSDILLTFLRVSPCIVSLSNHKWNIENAEYTTAVHILWWRAISFCKCQSKFLQLNFYLKPSIVCLQIKFGRSFRLEQVFQVAPRKQRWVRSWWMFVVITSNPSIRPTRWDFSILSRWQTSIWLPCGTWIPPI